MKIIAIGTGNAFSNLNYNASFLLDEGGLGMLVDCGFQVPAALYKAGIDLKTITDVYISHAHADHIGGLEALAFQKYDWLNKPQESNGPHLYANDRLMVDLWEHSLKGGLQSIEGLDATLKTFFKVNPITGNDSFDWGMWWECSLVQQIHIMTGSMISNTFGLFMDNPKKDIAVYFTTDSQHCSPRQVEIFYNKADIIFQDCECIGVDTSKKLSKFTSGVHANFAQLAGWESANAIKLSDKIKSKMWLTHYQDFVTQGKDMYGNPCDWDKLAKDEGFKGFLKVGQVIEV